MTFHTVQTLQGRKGWRMQEVIDIEALLVWAYQRQKVDRVSGAMFRHEAGQHWSNGSCLDGIARVASLGCAVDVSAWSGLPACDPDAELVHEAVGRIGPVGRTVARLARTGERPDWMKGVYRWKPEPLRDRDGRMVLAMTDGKRVVPGKARYANRVLRPWSWQPLVWRDRAHLLIGMRNSWMDWHRALDRLSRDLDGRLRRWRVTGPAVPLRPWLDDVWPYPDESLDKLCNPLT